MYLKRLKTLRKEHNLKQFVVANYLHITRQQYGLYELGKRDLPIHFLPYLAELYQTSTDYILELTNEIVPYEATPHELSLVIDTNEHFPIIHKKLPIYKKKK